MLSGSYFFRHFLNRFTFENILHLNSADWSCKHAIALLFGLTDHVVNIEDRTTISVTDAAVECYSSDTTLSILTY